MGIEFRVLGRVEVLVAGATVALGGPKQRALLAVLVREANSVVSVDRLADEIWGSAAPADPARSIQVYVSALRATLGAHAGVLETVGRGYRLVAQPDEIDAHRFAGIAADVTAQLASGQPDTARDTAARGLALWRGPAFADLADLPGTAADGTAAARLEGLRVRVEEERIAALLELGRHAEALTLLPALVAVHPLRERFAAQLLLALHRGGRRSEALDAYRAFRRRFVDELGLEPGAELRDLHAAVLRDEPGLRVEPAELRARRHLPVPPTAFIGRRAEVEHLTALLRRPDTRLVTATGPGGIGKTRLALQAAYELADAFPDGVYFVGLAGVHEPALVLPTVASVLGAEERAEEPLVAGVRQHLHQRRLLLLLDNFEHVEAAAPSSPNCSPRPPTSRCSSPAGNRSSCTANTTSRCRSSPCTTRPSRSSRPGRRPSTGVSTRCPVSVRCSSRSACGWTACHLRSSWPPLAAPSSPLRRCSPRWAQPLSLPSPARATCPAGSARCAPRSTGAIGCCPRRSNGSSRASPSSPAGSRGRRPRR